MLAFQLQSVGAEKPGYVETYREAVLSFLLLAEKCLSSCPISDYGGSTIKPFQVDHRGVEMRGAVFHCGDHP